MANTYLLNDTVSVKSSLELDLTLLEVLDQAMVQTQAQLNIFASNPEFAQKMAVAFGEDVKVEALQKAWLKRNFSIFPPIEIMSASEINGANGAYAAATDKIYLSKEFLQLHQNDASAVASVLLEEIGHRIDSQINENDSLGDEGEIFAASVLNQDLDATKLELLKREDDTAIVNINSNNVLIEQSTSSYSKSFSNDLGFQFKTSDYLNKFFGLNVPQSYTYDSGNKFIFTKKFGATEKEFSADTKFGGGSAGFKIDNGYFSAGIEAKAGYNLGELKLSLPVSTSVKATAVNNRLNFDLASSLNNPNFSYVAPYAYAYLGLLFGYDLKLDAFANAYVGYGKFKKSFDINNTLFDKKGTYKYPIINLDTRNDKQVIDIPFYKRFEYDSNFIQIPRSTLGGYLGLDFDLPDFKGIANQISLGSDYQIGWEIKEETKLVNFKLALDSLLAKIPILSWISKSDSNKKSIAGYDFGFEYDWRLLKLDLSAGINLGYNFKTGIKNLQPQIVGGEVNNGFSFANVEQLLSTDRDGGYDIDLVAQIDPIVFFEADIYLKPIVSLDWGIGYVGFELSPLFEKKKFTLIPGGSETLFSNKISIASGSKAIKFSEIYRLVTGKNPDFNQFKIEIPYNSLFPNVGTTGNDTLRLTGFANDNLYGGPGDDFLYGNSGQNVIKADVGNDTADGGGGNDTIYGEQGNDTLSGGTGNDELCGGIGDDRLYGGADNDTLYGEAGNDELYGDAGDDRLYGGADNDTLYGGAGRDELYGDVGNDRLYGGADNDTLYGGTGRDELYGDTGDDRLYGGDENDLLDGGEGNDILDGGNGDDVLVSDSGVDTIVGGAGYDTLKFFRNNSTQAFTITYTNASGGTASDGSIVSEVEYVWFKGGSGNDRINLSAAIQVAVQAGAGDDTITAGVGNDDLWGDGGNDVIKGGAGNDYLDGGAGNDELYGEAGNDQIKGGEGNDLLDGGIGDDRLYGGEGIDTLYGGSGKDELYGEVGNDILYGGEDSDILYGGIGNDQLYGEAGDDLLYGDSGNDILDGGLGIDVLDGGQGDDTLRGGSDADYLYGKGAKDVLYGGTGDDYLDGGEDNDTLYGDEGDDYLNGGSGNNFLYGGAGNDTLVGGAGDFLDGGQGNDIYYIGGFLTAGEVVIQENDGSGLLWLGNAYENPLLDLQFTQRQGQDLLINTAYINPNNKLTVRLKNYFQLNTDIGETLDFNDFTNTLGIAKSPGRDKILSQYITNKAPILNGNYGYSNLGDITAFFDRFKDDILLSETYWLNLDLVFVNSTQINGNTVEQIFNSSKNSILNSDRFPQGVIKDDRNVKAIAITSVDNTNGVWQYSLNNGQTWNSFSQLNGKNAFLLDSQHKVRFVPNQNFIGTANIEFRAWDKSTGIAGTYSNVIIGELAAFSAQRSKIEVNVINRLPVLDTSYTPSLTSIAYTNTNPLGNTVAEIVVDGSISDPDGNAIEAIAVTGVDNRDGTWQYSLDNGSNWLNFGSPDISQARLLSPEHKIRFVPNGNSLGQLGGKASFYFRAWDGIKGVAGGVADTRGFWNQDASSRNSFSSQVELAEVKLINTAPVLNNGYVHSLTPISNGNRSSQGNTIAQLVADGSITDAERVVEAIAITGVDERNGKWEYSRDGQTWNALWWVKETQAVLLNPTDKIRFIPNSDFAGTASFTFRAWDRSRGTDVQQTFVNTTINGNQTEFSSNQATATINILNDAPVLVTRTNGSPGLTAISNRNTNSRGNTVAQIVVDGSITDSSGVPVEAIAVTSVDNTNGVWQYSLDNGTTWLNFNNPTISTARLLGAGDRIRFVPNANYIGNPTFTYRAWDMTQGKAGEVANTSTSGGSTAFSAAIDTVAIAIKPSDNPGDTIQDALDTGLNYFKQQFSFSGVIGDNPGQTATDVDFYSFQLTRGSSISIDVNSPQSLRLRLFNSNGDQLTAIWSNFSTDNSKPEDIYFINDPRNYWKPIYNPNQPPPQNPYDKPPTTYYETFYLAVSAGDNTNYNPFVEGSGSSTRSTTSYNLAIDHFEWMQSAPDGNLINNVYKYEDTPSTTIDLSQVFSEVPKTVFITNSSSYTAYPKTGEVSIYVNPYWAGFLNAEIVGNNLVLNSLPDRVGAATVRILGLDNKKLKGETFTFAVDDVNDSPVLNKKIGERSAIEDQIFSFALPNDTFSDVDLLYSWGSETHTYNATLANGSPLPSWLTFNKNTKTFSGTPSDTDVGTLNVTVTVTDRYGASAQDSFTLTVVNTYDPPTLKNKIALQTVTEEQAFSFNISSNTFIGDPGEKLIYNATLEDGRPLPNWLLFDPERLSFTGKATSTDVGNLRLKVTATNSQGQSAQDIFTLTVVDANDPPVLVNKINSQTAVEDQDFIFVIPSTTFTDPDSNTPLTYTATLENGGSLPNWLTFDPNTLTFNGTPTNSSVGNLRITVIAADAQGGTAKDTFDIAVLNTNDAPTLENSISTQTATEERIFQFTIPINTFIDIDPSDTLTYTATLADGSSLPNWLTFAPDTRTFSGTPTNEDVGNLTIKVNVIDGKGANANATFTLQVVNVNNAPTLSIPITNKIATEETEFIFAINPNTFSDIDAGDRLTYSATLADGLPLPSWLNFNPENLTFSGTPKSQDTGTINVQVKVTDLEGATANSSFSLGIQQINKAPFLVNPIAEQITIEDTEFLFVLPENTFNDTDLGDNLTYFATTEDSIPLPNWLTFNPSTRAFSGISKNEDVGTLRIRVTATDNAGQTATNLFNLEITNTNDAPILGNPIAKQTVTENSLLIFTFAEDTFVDIDSSDSLTYTATLADGSLLPEWISLDSLNRTFMGIPTNDDVGTLFIKLIATDEEGASVDTTFAVDIENVNNAPTIVNPISEQIVATVTEDVPFSFTIPDTTFNDIDVGDRLSYTATLVNGLEELPLPSWLTFNPESLTFSGTATNDYVGTIFIQVTATDSQGESISDIFNLEVINVNDAPIMVNSNSELVDGTEDTEYIINTVDLLQNFIDVDGDILSIENLTSTHGTLIDNGDTTWTFTPDVNFNGKVDLSYKVIDGNGGNVGATQSFYIAAVNDAPSLTVPPTQAANSNTNLTIPGISLSDVDAGSNAVEVTLSATNGILSLGSRTGLIFSTGDGTQDRNLAFHGSLSAVNTALNNLIYRSDTGYFGTDSLTITASDQGNTGGTALSDKKTINITIYNTITGTSASETFSATVNPDRIRAGNGNDTVIATVDNLQQNDVINGEGGRDRFVLTGELVSTPLTLNLTNSASQLAGISEFPLSNFERFDFSGFAGTLVVVGGTQADEVIGTAGNDIMAGGGNNDFLQGGDGNDQLTGDAGNDTLDGGLGADTLLGGAGNDTYIVDTTNDIVTEILNAGTDTVQSSITWTLGEHLENLTLLGSATLNGTGNSLNNRLLGNDADNTLIGGAGNDTLNGGFGADTLTGGTGNDTYIVDLIDDIISEAFNEGTDTVQSSISWTLGNNLEHLVLTGTAAIDGTGNNINNTITGNSADNILVGEAGNDTLNGGLGADILIGGIGNDTLNLGLDSAVDTVIYSVGDGRDTVNQFTPGANGDLLSFTDNMAIDVVSNGSSTWFRLSDGIEGNAGFGTGSLLLTLNNTTGFTQSNIGLSLAGSNQANLLFA